MTREKVVFVAVSVVIFVGFAVLLTTKLKKASQELPFGTTCVLTNNRPGQQTVPIAFDEVTLRDIWCVDNPISVQKQRDDAISALSKAVEDKRAATVPSGKIKAVVIASKLVEDMDTEKVEPARKYNVKIVNGEYLGKQAWVSARWLTKQTVGGDPYDRSLKCPICSKQKVYWNAQWGYVCDACSNRLGDRVPED